MPYFLIILLPLQLRIWEFYTERTEADWGQHFPSFHSEVVYGIFLFLHFALSVKHLERAQRKQRYFSKKLWENSISNPEKVETFDFLRITAFFFAVLSKYCIFGYTTLLLVVAVTYLQHSLQFSSVTQSCLTLCNPSCIWNLGVFSGWCTGESLPLPQPSSQSNSHIHTWPQEKP